MTKAPAIIMYVGVVSRETVRIALIIATFNDLEVNSGNFLNAYVQAHVTKRVWTTLGPEFGKDARKTTVIIGALCGLKSAGAAFRSHLATCIESLGYESCKAGPDLWLKTEIRPEDGVKYYSNLLCYVDDIFCIHHNADTVLEWLHKSFLLKLGFGNPDMYLGAKLRKTRLHNRVWAWAMSPTKYVQEAVRNCAVHLSSNYGGKYRMPKKAENPFKMGYDPELDTSPELDPDAVSYYLTVIAILRWMIKLERIKKIMEVLLLLSHVVLPREGHLDAAVHVMAHVGQRYNS